MLIPTVFRIALPFPRLLCVEESCDDGSDCPGDMACLSGSCAGGPCSEESRCPAGSRCLGGDRGRGRRCQPDGAAGRAGQRGKRSVEEGTMVKMRAARQLLEKGAAKVQLDEEVGQ